MHGYYHGDDINNLREEWGKMGCINKFRDRITVPGAARLRIPLFPLRQVVMLGLL